MLLLPGNSDSIIYQVFPFFKFTGILFVRIQSLQVGKYCSFKSIIYSVFLTQRHIRDVVRKPITVVGYDHNFTFLHF